MLLAVLLLSCSTGKHSAKTKENIPPKREFRGAWIQAVNGQFMGMNEAEMKGYLTTMLDNLQKVNVNAIIFQVRVEGDALYPSPYEPWSRYMMGQQGKNPGWDPLAFMVAEAHKRNMEPIPCPHKRNNVSCCQPPEQVAPRQFHRVRRTALL